MPKRINYFFVYIFIVLSLGMLSCKKYLCQESDCDDFGSISIEVIHESSNGVVQTLENVNVTIRNTSVNPDDTNENGLVEFELCPNDYFYEIQKEGYEQNSNNPDKINVKCGEPANVKLRMNPTRAILQIIPERISLTRNNSEGFITVRNAGINTLEWAASILGPEDSWIEIVGNSNGALGAGEMKDVFIRVDFDNFLASGGIASKDVIFQDISGNSSSITALVDVIPELVFETTPGDITFSRLENYKEFTIFLTENISSPLSISISSDFPEGTLEISRFAPTLSSNVPNENISLDLNRAALNGYGFFTGRIFLDAGNNGIEIIDVNIEHPSPDNPYLEIESSSINPEILAFGSTSLQETLTLKNSGQSILEWNIVEVFPSWIENVSLTEGQLAVNQEVSINCTVDRSDLEEGLFYSNEIEINSNGGNKLITTTVSKGDPILEFNSLLRFPFNGNVDNVGTSDILASNSGGIFTSDPMGTPNKAISFNGESSYLSLTNPVQTEPSYTVSFWMRNLTHSSNSKTILSLKGNNWFEVKIQDDNLKAIHRYGSSSNSINTAISNDALDEENWNHIVILYNKLSANQKTIVVYINGVNSGFTVLENTSFYDNNQVSSIGCLNTNDEYWEGELDDFRIYPNILSEDQINILGGN